MPRNVTYFSKKRKSNHRYILDIRRKKRSKGGMSRKENIIVNQHDVLWLIGECLISNDKHHNTDRETINQIREYLGRL